MELVWDIEILLPSLMETSSCGKVVRLHGDVISGTWVYYPQVGVESRDIVGFRFKVVIPPLMPNSYGMTNLIA